jgi:hypothetical protein
VRPGAAAIAAAGIAAASPAGAVEREHHLGLDAGPSVLVMSDKTDVGGGAGAHYAYGLSDAFNLMVEGSWSLVALGERPSKGVPTTRPDTVGDAGVGVGYVLDVVRWVPYAGALVGGNMLTGGTVGTRFLPGATLALGLDYRCTRDLAVGFAFRQHMFVTDMTTYPSFTQMFARVEYTWGW